jgi:hypothetical protein
VAAGPGRISPRQDYNAGYGQDRTNAGYGQEQVNTGYDRRSPNGYDAYGQTAAQGYGVGQGRVSPPRNSPPMAAEYAGDRMRHSPAPQTRDDYGLDQPYDQPYSSNGGYSNRPYPAAQRNYSSDSQRPLASRPGTDRQYSSDESPNLQNNAGFDFNSGYSRPQQYNNYNSRQNGSQPQQPQQPQRQNGGSAYPGYRGYRA